MPSDQLGNEQLCAGHRAQNGRGLSGAPCAQSVRRVQIAKPVRLRIHDYGGYANRRDGYTIVAFVEGKKGISAEEHYHASGTERGVVGSSSFSFFCWVENGACPRRLALGPHHY